MRDSFILYTECVEQIGMLSREQRGDLLTAIYAYETEQLLPEMDTLTAMVFSIIRQKLDRDGEKYDRKCRKNAENINKRWNTNVYDRNEKDTTVYDRINSYGDNEPDPDNDPDCENEDEHEPTAKEKKPTAQKRKAEEYDPNPAVNDAVREFVRHRRALKRPMTDKAVQLFMTRLRKMARSPDEQIELINTAIERGWQTVYEPGKKDTIDWSKV